MSSEQSPKTANFKEHELALVAELVSHEELQDLSGDLPTDTHLVRFFMNGELQIDAVRARRTVDIFDAYHDIGATVLEIRSGYGRILPRLYKGE